MWMHTRNPRKGALVAEALTARNARVVVVGIGDSNQLFGGHGNDYGDNFALFSFFDQFATSVYSGGENDGNGNGHGPSATDGGSAVQGMFASGVAAASGLPSPFQPFVTTNAMAPTLCSQIVTSNTSGFGGRGVYIGSSPGTLRLIRPSEAIRAHWAYLRGGDGASGEARVAVRLDVAPFTELTPSLTLSSLRAGAPAFEVASQDLAADAGRTQQIAVLTCRAGQTLVAPFVGGFVQAEAIGKPGAMYTTLGNYGGQSVRQWVINLRQVPTALITRIFTHLRGLRMPSQTWSVFDFRWVGGPNDRNDTTLSVGPNPAPSNTAAGYYDNLVALRTLLRSFVALGGGNPDIECCFEASVSPRTGASDTTMDFARQATAWFSDDFPDVRSFDYNAASTQAQLDTWYADPPTDTIHFNPTGYRNLALLKVQSFIQSYSMLVGGQAIYNSRGATIDYTPESDVPAGTVVVQENLVGVALHTLVAGVTQSLAVQGVFAVSKASGATHAVGVKVYWDDVDKLVTESDGGGFNKYLGRVAEPAGAGAVRARVLLQQ
jgi:predicted RecA/RadA family phage recombinase